MKAHSSKLLKLCFVLAAFVFFLTALLMPVKMFAASAADGYNSGSGSGDPEPQMPIYYFSDSPSGRALKYEIESKTNGTVNYTPFNPGKDSDEQVQALDNLDTYAESSYVIFEFETPFAFDPDYGYQVITDKLNEIFSALKENGCYIMFICGTDEYLFRNDNAFLDYVDVHVNTDKITTFFTSILYWIKQDYDQGKIKNCVFFLDRGVAPYYELDNRYCSFVSFHLVRSIKLAYMNDIRYGTDFVEDVLKNKSIRILCHETDDLYYDIVYDEPIEISMDDSLFDENEHFYAVGTNRNGEDYSREWATEIRQACENKGREFTVYYYEFEEYGFGEDWYEPSRLGTLYTAHGAGASYLKDIIVDFVLGQDMLPYDNWTGRCVITHKVRVSNGYGWLVNLLDLLNLDSETVAYLDDQNIVWH